MSHFSELAPPPGPAVRSFNFFFQVAKTTVVQTCVFGRRRATMGVGFLLMKSQSHDPSIMIVSIRAGGSRLIGPSA